MNIAKIASWGERAVTKCRYARINLNAHLVPVVREMLGEFEKELRAKKFSPPLSHYALKQ